MGIIENIIYENRNNDTVFLKEDSDLQRQYDALKRLNEEYPDNVDIINELKTVKMGLDGENEIAYQLKNAHIGMYVLRDVKYKYEDLSAQIDFVVITPIYVYYIECKNLFGNITVNEKGDFIRELIIDNKTVTKGMYSPLRQVEVQREVIRKIWNEKVSGLNKILGEKYFEHYRRVLVVVANQDTILNTDAAPDNIKYKIIRADALVRHIEYDLEHRDKNDNISNQNEMGEFAKSYIDYSSKENINFYDYYKKKYCDDLKSRLIKLRNNRSKYMNIPAYYVFTNEELEKLLEVKPKTIEELRKILPSIKVDVHGKQIIDEINKVSE